MRSRARRVRRSGRNELTLVEGAAVGFAGLALAVAFIGMFALVGHELARGVPTSVTYDEYMRTL